MFRLRFVCSVLVLVLATALLGACGGGGGGGGGDGDAPTGPVLQGRFLPLAVGDRWRYAIEGGGTATVRAVGTRRVGGEDGIVLRTEDPLDGASESVHFISDSGVWTSVLAGGDPLLASLGRLQVMRLPLRTGETFVQLDATVGLGMDLDGDGREETATVRSQVQVIGLESVQTSLGSLAGCAHLRTTLNATVRASGTAQTVAVTTVSDDWYAPDIGPVRSVITTADPDGSQTLELTVVAWRVGGQRSETTPPVPVTRSPAVDGLQGATTRIHVDFDEPLAEDDAPLAMTLTDAAGRPVAGEIERDGQRLAFWPLMPLDSGRYTARVAAEVADWLGNPLGTELVWSFEIDVVGPQVVAVSPPPGALDVARDAVITVRYDEVLDGSALTADNVVLRSVGTSDVPVSVSVAGDTVTVTPLAPMARGAAYELVLGTYGYGARDRWGNWALGGSPVTQFTTDFGRFATPQPWPANLTPDAVAVGDVNGDGAADVVLAQGAFAGAPAEPPNRLAVLLQQPDGRLAAPTWMPLSVSPGCRPTSLAIGDVDGDGRQDVVVALFGCGLEVFRQAADGSLQAGVPLASPQDFIVHLADFNGDGRTDVLAAGWSDSVMRLWLQTPAGSLDTPATPAIGYAGWNTLAVGDLDGDGRPDIAVGSGQGDSAQAVGLILQLPDGRWSAQQRVGHSDYAFVGGVALGDADGDGRAELLASYNGRIAVWRLQAGVLQRGAELGSSGNAGPLRLADVNGDGRVDLVHLHTGGYGLGVHLQQAAGGLAGEVRYAGYAQMGTPDALAVADVSSDGRADLVMVSGLAVQRPVAVFAERAPVTAPRRTSLLPRLGTALRQ